MVMNPVLVQELRLRMRGGQAYLLLTAVILIFGGVCLATFWALTNVLRPVAPFPVQIVSQGGVGAISSQSAAPQLDRLLLSQRSVVFFLIMALWAVLLTALIVPGATSGTLARERETRSLSLLIGTPLSTVSLVLGKMLAAASYVLLVIAASIPLFAMVMMFGGIDGQQVAAVVVIVLATAFAFTAFGVFVSAIAKNGLLAALASYGVVIVLTIGSYIVYLASSPLSKAVNTKYALYLSPLASVMSAMTENNLQLESLVRNVFREPSPHIVGDWWALSSYPLWYVTTAAYVIAGVVFLIAASRVINPLRRWI